MGIGDTAPEYGVQKIGWLVLRSIESKRLKESQRESMEASCE